MSLPFQSDRGGVKFSSEGIQHQTGLSSVVATTQEMTTNAVSLSRNTREAMKATNLVVVNVEDFIYLHHTSYYDAWN